MFLIEVGALLPLINSNGIAIGCFGSHLSARPINQVLAINRLFNFTRQTR